ncbi:LysR substrate-binding domain-containing protein [Streptomyces sp. SKN60]|uniref:LysR substrate-binding domain-containing protein n=1 Tax=Streptomyces sp. SKN60 TaxID=2855506 RepID=UPI0022470910|nr:LysR substrate-binding domain-containing protein [Streptomyces sp. SKN60]
MMDLHALRQFQVVARLEHLSRAAEELHVAQPSLSRTIARLEGELGAPLFDRAGRLRLNDAGRAFLRHVERALGELEAGRRAVADIAEHGVGTVRIASETFLTLTGPLAAFKRAHPAVEVALHQMPAEGMGRALRAQEVDLCVASQPVPAEGLEAVGLLDEPVWVVTPLGHPLAERESVSVAELAEQPFVSTRTGHWQRRLLDRLFAAEGLAAPRIVCEGDEPSATAILVAAGLGIGLIPDMARRSATRAPVAWIAVDGAGCRRTLTLLRPANAHPGGAARLMHAALTGWDWSAGPV